MIVAWCHREHCYNNLLIFLFSAVVVVQNGTVLDLKHAIQRHMTLKLSRSKGKKHISWYTFILFCSLHYLKTKWTAIRVIESALYFLIQPTSFTFLQILAKFVASCRTKILVCPSHSLLTVPVTHTPLYSFRKYIWKRYWLYFEGQKLTEDKKQLKE